MTRKHYNELAARFGSDLAAISENGLENASAGALAARSGYLDAVTAIVSTLKCENIRFDSERFYDAVRVAEKKAEARYGVTV